jgi:hypothetical protein
VNKQRRGSAANVGSHERLTAALYRKPWVPVLIAFAIGLLWVVNQFDLLHIRLPNYDYVEVSRYMTGRWPTTWAEVETAYKDYSGSDFGEQHFESVRLVPLATDECVVTFRFKNLLGISYEERRKLTWSKEVAKRIADDDPHARVANSIAYWYCDWVRRKNRGKLSASMAGIQDVIESNRQSPPRVRRVTLAPSSTGPQHGKQPSAAPFLTVEFEDGVMQRVSISEELKHPSKLPP